MKSSTVSTKFITWIWKWLSPKELHHITPTSLRKEACNHLLDKIYQFLGNISGNWNLARNYKRSCNGRPYEPLFLGV